MCVLGPDCVALAVGVVVADKIDEIVSQVTTTKDDV